MGKQGAAYKIFVLGAMLVVVYAVIMLGIILSTW
jgi:hypothetical protein